MLLIRDMFWSWVILDTWWRSCLCTWFFLLRSCTLGRSLPWSVELARGILSFTHNYGTQQTGAHTVTHWLHSSNLHTLSPNYRSASVSVRFTDGRGNRFGRTVFDLYFSDGCGCWKQFTARTVGGAAVFWSQTSYYATSLSDRIRRSPSSQPSCHQEQQV